MTKRTYSLTPAASRRINAEAVVTLGELMLADGTVKPGTPEYTRVLRAVAAAKRTAQAVDYGSE